MDILKSEAVHEIADMFGNDDGLVRGDGAEGSAVEVVEMGVGDENEINRGEVVDFHARLLDALDDLEPPRPVGVDQETVFRGLNEK